LLRSQFKRYVLVNSRLPQNSIAGPSLGGITAGGGTGNVNGFKEPIMLFASPSGIALSTPQSNQLYADQQINLVSGQNTHVATGKSLIASIKDTLSLFVQNAGMKLFAAKGKVEIQAHSDNIELTAQKTLKIASATDKIEVAAKQEILLTAGGAYIRISEGNIEMHAPGLISIKGTQHSLSGPAARGYTFPALPSTDSHSKNHEQFRLLEDDEITPLANQYYVIEAESGEQWTGFSDENGVTQRVYTENPETLSVKVYKRDGENNA